jgi:hypothetical protein
MLRRLLARLGHYTSTSCLHRMHLACGIICAHCGRACRCACHKRRASCGEASFTGRWVTNPLPDYANARQIRAPTTDAKRPN